MVALQAFEAGIVERTLTLLDRPCLLKLCVAGVEEKKVTPARGVEGEKNSQTKISECVRCTTGCTDGGHFAFFLRSAARAAVESSSQPSTLFEARGTAPALTSDQIDELLLSARYGDLEDLESTLAPLLSSASSASSVLASIKNESANTLLHYACANGHLDVVTYLLPHSDLALLLAQNESGNTPLHWAALNGHLDTVKALVAHIEKLEAAHPEEAKKLNLIFHPKSSAHPEQPNEAHEGDQNDGSERKLWDVRNSAVSFVGVRKLAAGFSMVACIRSRRALRSSCSGAELDSADGASHRLHRRSAGDGLGLDEALDLGNGVVEDLLLQLVVLERVLHLLDHAGCELALLLLTLGRLEAHPRIEHRLDLGRERRLLSQLENLLLRLRRLLGHRVQRLRQANNVLLLLHRVNARLNGLGVLGTSAVEDVRDFL
ncbi:hypothetical protein L1887_60642 [Cichorium endivia]|nr:hypothetical protein L1887_60642 [Cichorium endivia]